MDLSGLGQGPVAVACENCNEPSVISERERISQLPSQPIASQGLSCMELDFCGCSSVLLII